jgi:peptidoglycan hydrolase CwlO-like protein
MQRKGLIFSLAILLMCLATTGLYAQANNGADNSNNGGGGRGGRFGRGNFDPAQYRQQMMDDLKKELDVKDDEWQVLQPKLEKVMDSSRELRSNMFRFGRSGRGGSDRGGQPQSSSQQDSAVAKAQADLESALNDKSIGADEISKRLAAYRSAKDQAKQNLAKAQSELKELVSQRQEAVLVMRGMLD